MKIDSLPESLTTPNKQGLLKTTPLENIFIKLINGIQLTAVETKKFKTWRENNKKQYSELSKIISKARETKDQRIAKAKQYVENKKAPS